MTPQQAWAEVYRQFAQLMQDILLGVGSRLAPVNLLTMLVLALLIYLWRRPDKSFLAWAFPRHFYTSKSFGVDVKLFVVNRVLKFFQVLNGGLITGFFAAFTAQWLGSGSTTTAAPNLVLVALVLLLVNDGGYYLLHRVYHEAAVLWPLHSVHHSAEILTPVTAYRAHPIYGISNTLFKAMLIGITQGVLLGLLFNQVDLLTIAGVNIFYAVFNMATSNLRHMHIWLSFGRVIEHVFISPAQHQIHHSTDPRHINKNYGEILAIWDWMFGTLYVPEKREMLEFGISDGAGNRIPQPHPTFTRALIVPLQQIAVIIASRFGKKPASEDTASSKK